MQDWTTGVLDGTKESPHKTGKRRKGDDFHIPIPDAISVGRRRTESGKE